jgi:hypothetical protein
MSNERITAALLTLQKERDKPAVKAQVVTLLNEAGVPCTLGEELSGDEPQIWISFKSKGEGGHLYSTLTVCAGKPTLTVPTFDKEIEGVREVASALADAAARLAAGELTCG